MYILEVTIIHLFELKSYFNKVEIKSYKITRNQIDFCFQCRNISENGVRKERFF